MQYLPLGIQDFRTLREGNLLYVDKTAHLLRLATEGKYYFLSRPRRFGKSLTLSTLKEMFLGSQELFKGLYIEDKWDWSRKLPVVHISFNVISYKTYGVTESLKREIHRQAEMHGVTLKGESIKELFNELPQKLSAQGRVVLLIDEYDKPIIDYLEDLEQAKKNRDELKELFSTIKDNDPYWQFVFITGVSKFSRVSIFSDLNNLNDLTMHPRYTTMLGYTQKELLSNFKEWIPQTAAQMGVAEEKILEGIKEWYNGYSWGGDERLYNPFSVLNFFDKGRFKNYWFITGTPTFLIRLLKKHFYHNFDGIQVADSSFESYDLENLNISSLLVQTGYLTLKSEEEDLYTLGFPNKEVRDSMLRHLVGAFSHDTADNSTPTVYALRKAFSENDLEKVMEILDTAFSKIPYNLFDAHREGYYHSLVYLLFSYLGVFVECETLSRRGRLDAVVHTPERIYILEFKLDLPAAAGIQQIKDKGYAEPYRGRGKKVIAVGVSFSSEKKAIGDWLEEELF